MASVFVFSVLGEPNSPPLAVLEDTPCCQQTMDVLWFVGASPLQM